MKIPNFLLNQTASIETPLGTNAFNEVAYDVANDVKCRIEPKRKKLTNANGDSIVSEALAFFDASLSIDIGSKVISNGRIYEVLEVRTQFGLSTASHLEVYLV